MAENASTKKKKKQPFIYPIVFMMLLAAILTLVLATLNQTTYGIIKEQEDLAIQKSILYTLDVSYSSETELRQIIKQDLEEKSSGNYTYYEYKEQGKVVKYAFPIQGKALWGTVDGFGATDVSLQTLIGVDFVKHSETPGLGGRISEDWYKDQFRQVDISGQSPYVIYKPASGGNIDAITGATLTSNSVRDMVNQSIDEFKQKIGGVSP